MIEKGETRGWRGRADGEERADGEGWVRRRGQRRVGRFGPRRVEHRALPYRYPTVSTQDEPPPLPFVGADDQDVYDPVNRVRQVLRTTTPGTEMTSILELGADSAQLEHTRRLIVGGVEELTGLRLGELQALTAVAEGADHYRTIARLTAQADAAAAATVDGLVRKGLLARHHHPAEPNASAEPTLVHLTPKGEAVLGQSEAIRIRLLDTLAQSLSQTELEQVRAAADALRLGRREPVRPQIGGTAAVS